LKNLNHFRALFGFKPTSSHFVFQPSIQMSMRLRLLPVIGAIVLCGVATRAPAQDLKLPAAVLQPLSVEGAKAPPTDGGSTLARLLDGKLLILVKPPLPQSVVNQLSGDPHRTGTPPEFLTPGDTGIAIRFRW
jgi:hypothetical protein